MAHTPVRRLFLLLVLPALLVVSMATSACGFGSSPEPTSVPTPPGRHDLDMKPMVRDYFANAPEDWNLIAGEDALRAKPFVVDVRQSEEYAKGFIEGAVNIPLGELVRSLSALPATDKDILLVCNSGHRSTVGMMVLQLLGYKKAKSLIGGMAAWEATKLPVVTAPVPKRPAGPSPKVNPDVRATLDYYLSDVQQVDWGRISPVTLTEDRKLKSSAEMEIQPETFDQGPSLLLDVDGAEDYARANLTKAINLPLRDLTASLDNLPLEKLVLWA